MCNIGVILPLYWIRWDFMDAEPKPVCVLFRQAVFTRVQAIL
jgi:hypothetical protein